MSSMTFGQKIFKPKPPIQGSFPLDHEGECKKELLEYMICVSGNKTESTKCRDEAKSYLKCRMDKQLMNKQDLESLGFKDS
jgi:cytochrome c oxidase assembly protein subunit 19